jgi:PhnB protein
MLSPYIFFKGNAKEAMEFYKGVFGGDLTMSTLGESPKEVLEQMKIDESRYGEIMHAELKGGIAHLFASDSQKASDKSAKVELSISGSDEDKLRQIWKALAEDGNITMPMSKQFWGAEFGMLTDKFGVDWMVNIEPSKQAS